MNEPLFDKVIEVGLRNECDQSHYRQNLFKSRASSRSVLDDKISVAPMFKFAGLVGSLNVVANLIIGTARAQHSVNKNLVVNHEKNRDKVLIDELGKLFNARNVLHDGDADFVALIGVEHVGLE